MMSIHSRVARWILVVSLAAGFVTSTTAQEARWKELNARVADLYKQEKYAEAVAIAQEALRVAQRTFGKETHELMTLFYAKWLGGADKHEALRGAQQELRTKYPDPASWGAFVLVGR